MTGPRPISEQQRDFASAYVFDPDTAGNAAASAVKAGFAEGSARQQGYRLLRNDTVRAEIDKLTREALGDGAAASVSLLRRILGDPRTDAAMMRIKLDAAKAILDRAGFVAPKAQEAPVDPTARPMNTWSISELDAFIADGKTKLETMIANRNPQQDAAE